ncbi:MAG: hypothetical protein ABIP75_15895 [Pyrinomonadaceae bacterium]
MKDIVKAEFEASINQLVGKPCWGFVAGAPRGSVVSLDIGRKLPSESPRKNTHLTVEQRRYDAEFILFIHCVWRLDSKSKVVCGAWSDNRKGGAMLKGLQRLVGEVIHSVSLSKPAFDLQLTFSNKLVLSVFCDAVNEADEYDNYSLFLPTVIYTVGTWSRLSREHRSEAVMKRK